MAMSPKCLSQALWSSLDNSGEIPELYLIKA